MNRRLRHRESRQVAVFGSMAGLKVIYETPFWGLSTFLHVNSISSITTILQVGRRGCCFSHFPDEETEAEKGLYDICYIISSQKFEINKVIITSCLIEIMH